MLGRCKQDYMKIRILISIFIISCQFQNSFGQNNSLLKKINLLSEVSNIPFDSCQLWDKDCGDDIIWEIAKYGKAAIKPLIDKISDTSYSNFYFPDINKLTRLKTGDIAYITLKQIISFHNLPKQNEFDVHICGGYEVDLFTVYFLSFSYRLQFQRQIREEYNQKKTQMDSLYQK